jgi:hypothetical protein
MRQIFTSPRLENVERVAQLLDENGILNKITAGRTYKGHSRRQFSYAEKAKEATEQPAVWVIRPDDYKQARELMHDAGLLDQTSVPSYLPENLQFADKPVVDPAKRLLRIKVTMLFVMLVVIGGMMARAYLSR